MTDHRAWAKMLAEKALARFGARVWFMGLQGSVRRGAASFVLAGGLSGSLRNTYDVYGKRKGCCSGRRIPLPGSGLKKVHKKGGAGQNMRI